MELELEHINDEVLSVRGEYSLVALVDGGRVTYHAVHLDSNGVKTWYPLQWGESFLAWLEKRGN